MRYLLDTNVVLYLLGGRLATPLDAGSYGVSVVSEMELLSYQTLTAEDEEQIRRFLANVTIVDLSANVKATTIALRRRHSLKLPDAIVAASAQSWEAELLTNDLQLLRIPAIRSKSVGLRG